MTFINSSSLISLLLCSCMFFSSTLSMNADDSDDPVYQTKAYCDDAEACSNLMRKIKIYATNGSPKAQLFLAVAYLNGDGIELSQSKAMKWIKKAARNPYPQAHRVISGWYRYGWAGEKNIEKADYYLDKAIEAGDIVAIISLGSMKFNAGKLEEAKTLFTIAADKGSSKAKHILSLMDPQPETQEDNHLTSIAVTDETATQLNSPQPVPRDTDENVITIIASHSPVELLTIFVEDTHPIFKTSHSTGSRLPGVKCGKSAATSPCKVYTPEFKRRK